MTPTKLRLDCGNNQKTHRWKYFVIGGPCSSALSQALLSWPRAERGQQSSRRGSSPTEGRVGWPHSHPEGLTARLGPQPTKSPGTKKKTKAASAVSASEIIALRNTQITCKGSFLALPAPSKKAYITQGVIIRLVKTQGTLIYSFTLIC